MVSAATVSIIKKTLNIKDMQVRGVAEDPSASRMALQNNFIHELPEILKHHWLAQVAIHPGLHTPNA
jgi:hypothetical protein